MRNYIVWQLGALAFIAMACGKNVFVAAESHDPADRAAALLDQKKADAAISVLSDALEEQPSNWTLVSLMASAKAQKAGVDTTDIAFKMMQDDDKGETSEASSNALTSLFSILPAATSEGIALMLESVTFINSIPAEERINADTFKLSMFNTAYTALQTKFFDGDGDGKFTVEELASLDEATAIAILDSLLNVEAAAAAYTSGDTSGQAAGKVGAIASAINTQPGATTSEKLKNYLGAGK